MKNDKYTVQLADKPFCVFFVGSKTECQKYAEKFLLEDIKENKKKIGFVSNGIIDISPCNF